MSNVEPLILLILIEELSCSIKIKLPTPLNNVPQREMFRFRESLILIVSSPIS